jgi:Fur family peroxide stress response transcriptional regulator
MQCIVVASYREGSIMVKYSRQRECIKNCLMNRYDHPTADTIYQDVKVIYPNISLGTVYRNLALLSETGEILKISTGDGPDRFDGDVTPHYHFLCKECGRLLDIRTSDMIDIETLNNVDIPGVVEDYSIQFRGRCSECLKASSI